MKNHKSHHIFLYLGLLVLLFVFVFGVHYFQGTYQFKEVVTIETTSSYDEGIDTINPFQVSSAVAEASKINWHKFKKDNVMFAYPREYQLRMNNKASIFITAPYSISDDCPSIVDEQARALCYKPQLSPNISITTHMGISDNPFTNETTLVLVDGEQWQRTAIQGEYGGTVSFIKSYMTETIEVTYNYVDTDGGFSFASLQKNLGNQYQLSQKNQEQLVRDIISTIEVK